MLLKKDMIHIWVYQPNGVGYTDFMALKNVEYLNTQILF